MNKLISILILVMLFFLSSCEKNTFENVGQVTLKNNFNEQYMKAETVALELKSPKSMVQIKNEIVVADTGNDRVIILNYQGEIQKVIGVVGNKKGEFIRPTAIGVGKYNDVIVGDSGNGRIQVFDNKGNFKREIIIEKFNDSSFNEFKDIVVDVDNNIYVSTETPDKKKLGVYVISTDNKIIKIANGLWGNLFSDGEKVYLVTQGEWNQKEQTFYSETSYVLEIDIKKELKPILKLPPKFTPRCIIKKGDRIILYSHGYSSINIFDLEWGYIETIIKEDFSTTTGWCDIVADEDENIYVLNQLEGQIDIYQFAK